MSELGLPGDLIGEDEKRNPEQWRVGGRPCLPQTLHWTGQDACKVCGSKSSFVLQVSDARCDDWHTGYLVFGCVQKGCGRKTSSWRAFTFRIQSSKEADPEANVKTRQSCDEEGRNTDSEQRAAPDPLFDTTDTWGPQANQNGREIGMALPNTLNADQGQAQTTRNRFKNSVHLQDSNERQQTPPAVDSNLRLDSVSQHKAAAFSSDNGEKISVQPQSGFLDSEDDDDYDDLLNQLDNALDLSADSDKSLAESPKIPSDNIDRSQTLEDPSSKMVQSSCLEKAEEVWLPEFYLHRTAQNYKLEARPSKQDEKHILELLAAYEAEGNTLPTNGGLNSSRSDESWAEKYEASAVQGIESGYLKFSKHLKRSPQQCIRFRGELCWPKKTLPKLAQDQCKHCKSNLEFRMQLMPPLMSLLDESAEWLGWDIELNPLHDWEWTTVAIFACPNDCKLDATSFQECFVAIANE